MNVALEIAKQKSNGDTAPVLERIEAESNRLNDMISRLLTLSRLETGSDDFERSEIDLKTLVEQVASDADFEANAVGKSVKITEADHCHIVGSDELGQQCRRECSSERGSLHARWNFRFRFR
jgi:two-component system sensor histidine kinase CpxA